MRWPMIGFLLVAAFSWTSHAMDGKLSMGMGYEAKMDRDVNPADQGVDSMGELFTTLAYHPWSGLFEIDRYQTMSGDGNYSVQSTSYTPMFWGRYEPWSYFKVSPFGGIGAGWKFQDVTTTFGNARDDRWADGGAVGGLSVGLMSDFWQHWKVESELRILKQEFDNRPIAAFVLRSGYTF